MLDDERKLSADQIIDSRACDTDKIMEPKPENVYAHSSLAGAWPQQARGNSARHTPSIEDIGQYHVEKSGSYPTHQNCRQGTRNNHG